MAKRTITSPGVEIRESDLSLRTANTGTTTYLAGFAPEGPTDEVVGLSNITEFEQIYGAPTTPAERYFYHSARAALNSTGKLLVNRLPYGESTGQGFGSKISVLAYPSVVWDREAEDTSDTFTTSENQTTTLLGRPTQFEITQQQYVQLKNGTLFDWSDTAKESFGGITDLSGAAVVVVNKAMTTIDNQFNGYYIGLADNTNINPASAYEAIGEAFTTTQSAGDGGNSDYTTIPNSRFGFALTATPEFGDNPAGGSISQIMEDGITDYNLAEREFDDALNLGVFKLRQSTFSKQASQLDYLLEEGYNGSIGYYRQRNAENGGAPVNFSLESAEDTSRNIDVIVNPFLSDQGNGVQLNTDGTPKRKIRVYSNSLKDNLTNGNILSSVAGFPIDAFDVSDVAKEFTVATTVTTAVAGTLNLVYTDATGTPVTIPVTIVGGETQAVLAGKIKTALSGNSDITCGAVAAGSFTATLLASSGDASLVVQDTVGGVTVDISTLTEFVDGKFGDITIEKADNLVPLGAFGGVALKDKIIGSIPAKLDRALERIRNDRKFDIDMIAEAGLGTIHTYMETATVAQKALGFDDTKTTDKIEAMRTSNDLDTDGEDARTAYMNVFGKLATFAGPIKDGGRGDILFVADPIRQLLVTGKNSKIQKDPDRNFYVDIYWALRHQFSLANTSYATVFANWMRVYDNYTGLNVYVPSSGFATAKMASTDAQIGPWGAPAGFNRGIITDAADIAISPNQRQRDDLYSVNLNPIANFADQGNVFFGQKTLLKKPSAFDRINVRRTFLYLEKITKKTMQFFLFENNTLFTRTRVSNTLTPFFDRVKNADGLYDFMIVCDDRNNTGEVIDQNELVVDIYLKPVRTAEFILVNFYATRTDTSFEELLGS